MAHQITFGTERVLANNNQFSRLFEFAIDVAETACRDQEERNHLVRMKKLFNEEFWPGRHVEIENDFPDVAERKFWSRVFYDAARAIFDRSVGQHAHEFWQAQTIWQAYGTAHLFEQAVRTVEPTWVASSRDRAEFERVVNKREPA